MISVPTRNPLNLARALERGSPVTSVSRECPCRNNRNKWHFCWKKHWLYSRNLSVNWQATSTACMLFGADHLIIGYKEFDSYLSSPEPSEKAFKAAVEHMKLSTRQYSRRQISWIRNKLLPAVYAINSEETVTPTYLLDATGN